MRPAPDRIRFGGRQGEQMVAGGAGAVCRLSFQKRSDVSERLRDAAASAPADSDRPTATEQLAAAYEAAVAEAALAEGAVAEAAGSRLRAP